MLEVLVSVGFGDRRQVVAEEFLVPVPMVHFLVVVVALLVMEVMVTV